MHTKGGKRGLVGGGGVMNWEIGIDVYTLICIKWVTNKNLLYKKIKQNTKKKKAYWLRLPVCATLLQQPKLTEGACIDKREACRWAPLHMAPPPASQLDCPLPVSLCQPDPQTLHVHHLGSALLPLKSPSGVFESSGMNISDRDTPSQHSLEAAHIPKQSLCA